MAKDERPSAEHLNRSEEIIEARESGDTEDLSQDIKEDFSYYYDPETKTRQKYYGDKPEDVRRDTQVEIDKDTYEDIGTTSEGKALPTSEKAKEKIEKRMQKRAEKMRDKARKKRMRDEALKKFSKRMRDKFKDADAGKILKQTRKRFGKDAPVKRLGQVAALSEQARKIERKLNKEDYVIINKDASLTENTGGSTRRGPRKQTVSKDTFNQSQQQTAPTQRTQQKQREFQQPQMEQLAATTGPQKQTIDNKTINEAQARTPQQQRERLYKVDTDDIVSPGPRQMTVSQDTVDQTTQKQDNTPMAVELAQDVGQFAVKNPVEALAIGGAVVSPAVGGPAASAYFTQKAGKQFARDPSLETATDLGQTAALSTAGFAGLRGAARAARYGTRSGRMARMSTRKARTSRPGKKARQSQIKKDPNLKFDMNRDVRYEPVRKRGRLTGRVKVQNKPAGFDVQGNIYDSRPRLRQTKLVEGGTDKPPLQDVPYKPDISGMRMAAEAAKSQKLTGLGAKPARLNRPGVQIVRPSQAQKTLTGNYPRTYDTDLGRVQIERPLPQRNVRDVAPSGGKGGLRRGAMLRSKKAQIAATRQKSRFSPIENINKYKRTGRTTTRPMSRQADEAPLSQIARRDVRRPMGSVWQRTRRAGRSRMDPRSRVGPEGQQKPIFLSLSEGTAEKAKTLASQGQRTEGKLVQAPQTDMNLDTMPIQDQRQEMAQVQKQEGLQLQQQKGAQQSQLQSVKQKLSQTPKTPARQTKKGFNTTRSTTTLRAPYTKNQNRGKGLAPGYTVSYKRNGQIVKSNPKTYTRAVRLGMSRVSNTPADQFTVKQRGRVQKKPPVPVPQKRMFQKRGNTWVQTKGRGAGKGGRGGAFSL